MNRRNARLERTHAVRVSRPNTGREAYGAGVPMEAFDVDSILDTSTEIRDAINESNKEQS